MRARLMPRAHNNTPICFLIALICSTARAQSWCATTWPNAVFCDDFDEYEYGGSAFGDQWVIWGPCSSPLELDTDFYSSPPFAGRTSNQENGDLGYSNNSISDACRVAFGQAYSSVIGTNLNPLVLELVMNGQTAGKAKYNNSFLTLGSSNATAPTDWAWSPFCGCGSTDPRYPIICQQEQPGSACPPIGNAPASPVIAVGFLAYLDSDPCHCSGGIKSPFNEHLSLFDGHKWYKLRAGLFPGSGDFRLRDHENRIRITMNSVTLKIELTTPDTGEYSWAELTGAYLGPFNSMSAGFPLACQLNVSNWTCRGDPNCDGTVGVPGGATPRYDNIVLHGGVGYATPGACCFSNTTCTLAYCGDCMTMGGQCGTPGSTCANTACCPPQPGDHDLDTDVDMADFGWFQRCLSGTDIPVSNVPCRCADLNNDGAADGADVLIFAKCMLGPDVPASPTCVN